MKSEYKKLLESADRDTLLRVLLEIDVRNEAVDYNGFLRIDPIIEEHVSGTLCDHPLSPNFWETSQLRDALPDQHSVPFDQVSSARTRELVQKMIRGVRSQHPDLLP